MLNLKLFTAHIFGKNRCAIGVSVVPYVGDKFPNLEETDSQFGGLLSPSRRDIYETDNPYTYFLRSTRRYRILHDITRETQYARACDGENLWKIERARATVP